jgi:hypothetical protein
MKLNCTNCGEYVGSDIADEIERLQDKLLRAVSVLKELRDDGLSDRYVQDEARNKRVRAVIAENEGAAERLVGVEDWRDGSRPRVSPREAAAEIDRLREALAQYGRAYVAGAFGRHGRGSAQLTAAFENASAVLEALKGQS